MEKLARLALLLTFLKVSLAQQVSSCFSGIDAKETLDLKMLEGSTTSMKWGTQGEGHDIRYEVTDGKDHARLTPRISTFSKPTLSENLKDCSHWESFNATHDVFLCKKNKLVLLEIDEYANVAPRTKVHDLGSDLDCSDMKVNPPYWYHLAFVVCKQTIPESQNQRVVIKGFSDFGVSYSLEINDFFAFEQGNDLNMLVNSIKYKSVLTPFVYIYSKDDKANFRLISLDNNDKLIDHGNFMDGTTIKGLTNCPSLVSVFSNAESLFLLCKDPATSVFTLSRCNSLFDQTDISCNKHFLVLEYMPADLKKITGYASQTGTPPLLELKLIAKSFFTRRFIRWNETAPASSTVEDFDVQFKDMALTEVSEVVPWDSGYFVRGLTSEKNHVISLVDVGKTRRSPVEVVFPQERILMIQPRIYKFNKGSDLIQLVSSNGEKQLAFFRKSELVISANTEAENFNVKVNCYINGSFVESLKINVAVAHDLSGNEKINSGEPFEAFVGSKDVRVPLPSEFVTGFSPSFSVEGTASGTKIPVSVNFANQIVGSFYSGSPLSGIISMKNVGSDLHLLETSTKLVLIRCETGYKDTEHCQQVATFNLEDEKLIEAVQGVTEFAFITSTTSSVVSQSRTTWTVVRTRDLQVVAKKTYPGLKVRAGAIYYLRGNLDQVQMMLIGQTADDGDQEWFYEQKLSKITSEPKAFTRLARVPDSMCVSSMQYHHIFGINLIGGCSDQDNKRIYQWAISDYSVNGKFPTIDGSYDTGFTSKASDISICEMGKTLVAVDRSTGVIKYTGFQNGVQPYKWTTVFTGFLNIDRIFDIKCSHESHTFQVLARDKKEGKHKLVTYWMGDSVQQDGNVQSQLFLEGFPVVFSSFLFDQADSKVKIVLADQEGKLSTAVVYLRNPVIKVDTSSLSSQTTIDLNLNAEFIRNKASSVVLKVSKSLKLVEAAPVSIDVSDSKKELEVIPNHAVVDLEEKLSTTGHIVTWSSDKHEGATVEPPFSSTKENSGVKQVMQRAVAEGSLVFGYLGSTLYLLQEGSIILSIQAKKVHSICRAGNDTGFFALVENDSEGPKKGTFEVIAVLNYNNTWKAYEASSDDFKMANPTMKVVHFGDYSYAFFLASPSFLERAGGLFAIEKKGPVLGIFNFWENYFLNQSRDFSVVTLNNNTIVAVFELGNRGRDISIKYFKREDPQRLNEVFSAIVPVTPNSTNIYDWRKLSCSQVPNTNFTAECFIASTGSINVLVRYDFSRNTSTFSKSVITPSIIASFNNIPGLVPIHLTTRDNFTAILMENTQQNSSHPGVYSHDRLVVIYSHLKSQNAVRIIGRGCLGLTKPYTLVNLWPEFYIGPDRETRLGVNAGTEEVQFKTFKGWTAGLKITNAQAIKHDTNLQVVDINGQRHPIALKKVYHLRDPISTSSNFIRYFLTILSIALLLLLVSIPVCYCIYIAKKPTNEQSALQEKLNISSRIEYSASIAPVDDLDGKKTQKTGSTAVPEYPA